MELQGNPSVSSSVLKLAFSTEVFSPDPHKTRKTEAPPGVSKARRGSGAMGVACDILDQRVQTLRKVNVGWPEDCREIVKIGGSLEIVGKGCRDFFGLL